MSDTVAVDLIQAILDGTEWDAGTATVIADAVRATGRRVRDLHEHRSEQEQPELDL